MMAVTQEHRFGTLHDSYMLCGLCGVFSAMLQLLRRSAKYSWSQDSGDEAEPDSGARGSNEGVKETQMRWCSILALCRSACLARRWPVPSMRSSFLRTATLRD